MVALACRYHSWYPASRRVQGRKNFLSGGTLGGIRQGAARALASGTGGSAMTDQKQKAERFRALHVPGKPLVLFNVWDASSAKTVVAGGAKAVATSSWSVANANGFGDGEQVPLAMAIDNLYRIVSATDLPVTIDLESGYGDAPEAVGETIHLAIEAGAVGCNLEDSIPSTGIIREVADQCNRIRCARQTADTAKIRFFLNARTDVFFQKSAEQHDSTMVAMAIERAR